MWANYYPKHFPTHNLREEKKAIVLISQMGKRDSQEFSDTPKVTQLADWQELWHPTLSLGAPSVATTLKSICETHVEGIGVLHPKRWTQGEQESHF